MSDESKTSNYTLKDGRYIDRIMLIKHLRGITHFLGKLGLQSCKRDEHIFPGWGGPGGPVVRDGFGLKVSKDYIEAYIHRILNSKTTPAAARFFGIRVIKGEPRSIKTVGKVKNKSRKKKS